MQLLYIYNYCCILVSDKIPVPNHSPEHQHLIPFSERRRVIFHTCSQRWGICYFLFMFLFPKIGNAIIVHFNSQNFVMG